MLPLKKLAIRQTFCRNSSTSRVILNRLINTNLSRIYQNNTLRYQQSICDSSDDDLQSLSIEPVTFGTPFKRAAKFASSSDNNQYAVRALLKQRHEIFTEKWHYCNPDNEQELLIAQHVPLHHHGQLQGGQLQNAQFCGSIYVTFCMLLAPNKV